MAIVRGRWAGGERTAEGQALWRAVVAYRAAVARMAQHLDADTIQRAWQALQVRNAAQSAFDERKRQVLEGAPALEGGLV